MLNFPFRWGRKSLWLIHYHSKYRRTVQSLALSQTSAETVLNNRVVQKLDFIPPFTGDVQFASPSKLKTTKVLSTCILQPKGMHPP